MPPGKPLEALEVLLERFRSLEPLTLRAHDSHVEPEVDPDRLSRRWQRNDLGIHLEADKVSVGLSAHRRCQHLALEAQGLAHAHKSDQRQSNARTLDRELVVRHVERVLNALLLEPRAPGLLLEKATECLAEVRECLLIRILG